MNTRSQCVDTDKRHALKYLSEGVRHLRKSKQQAIAEYDKSINEKMDKIKKLSQEIVEECRGKIVEVTATDASHNINKYIGYLEVGRFENIFVYNDNPEYIKEKSGSQYKLVSSIPYEYIVNIEII